MAQVYVNDIIFGFISETKSRDSVNTMECEFKMSLVGKLNYFLSLQVKQVYTGIFISQAKYIKKPGRDV